MSSSITAVRDRAYWLSRGVLRGAPRLSFVSSHDVDDGAQCIDLPWPADIEQATAKITGGNELLAHVLVAAALDVTLLRYLGDPHVVIGTPPRRTPGQPEPSPNLLVMAQRIDPAMPFRSLLLELRKAFIESYSHQDFQLEDLLHERDEDRPLHTVTLVHEGLHGALPPIDDDLRLTVGVEPTGRGRVLRVETRGRIPAEVARGVGEHVLRVLRQALSDLERPVGSIDILEPAERTTVLCEWNATVTPVAELVHDLFRAYCCDQPDAPAIVRREGPAVSYAQLGQRSRAISAFLATRGSGPETRVGICVSDPVARAAAVLGVLESGGAYVPLDLAHPAARLSQMIGDSEPLLVLCDSETRSLLPLTAPCVLVDDIPTSDGPAARVSVAATNSAYVMYTSGSTGSPNGVVVTHGGLANAVAHARQLYRAGPKSRVLQFSSFSFDASAIELFLALTSGGVLCVAPDVTKMYGDALARAIRDMGVDTAVLTPTVLSELDPDSVPALGTVSVGGERCPGALATRWGRRRLLNCYGPTETTLFSTAEICDGAASDPPIGRPIANTRAYVLNAALQPLPPGVPGELYVAGAGVARGYLRQPSRTAARFVPDPHSEQPGARMYRTGDVARHRADGRLEFLGRTDDQVKLNGIRIELGEVEAALLAHPDVTGAAVSLCGGDAPRLVAYLVSSQDPPSAAELRSFLEQRLPAFSVPSVFVPLARLPVTPNGKL
ncbi:MAG: amino acid adenylation domain-containing protein, partial [Myxococcales bacterium]|nr:amino acid adenylation domain-containing protein [Myxococcales bacterium]